MHHFKRKSSLFIAIAVVSTQENEYAIRKGVIQTYIKEKTSVYIH